jgi:protein SCO1/2
MCGSRRARTIGVALLLLLGAGQRLGAQQYAVTGMVLQVDPSRRSFLVSHDSISGLMGAMTMPFEVREPRELEGVLPGMTVTFTLILDRQSAHAERVRVVRYESVESDPLTARRLKLLKDRLSSQAAAPKPLTTGEAVPDFTLTNQARQEVTLSRFRGKIIAVNFIYTSCALPQFCFRIANHFGELQRRFAERLGRELVLLTVTFDPVRDQPERLAEYARQWKASPDAWHFLTGGVPDVRRVCGMFGVDVFQDEGLFNHSSRTAVIDRQGKLVANLEGNQFSAVQLGDLVGEYLNR